ncbi:MAG: sulfurtransferase [Lautropia sp.]
MIDTTSTHDGCLVEPAQLAAELGRRRHVVIDARTPQAHAADHVPGAVFHSTYDLFVPDSRPAGMAEFRREAAARFARIGVSPEVPVIVYEDETGMRAARELWILEYLGHRNVRMLHGGLDGWRASGGALERGAVEAVPTDWRPAVRESMAVGADEIHEGLGRPGRTLIDVRDANEYAGRDDTACCERRGRLPGAVWIEWTEFLHGGRYRSAARIRELLRERGVPEGDELVPYCHRGARSANVCVGLRYAGFRRVRNYIGSFHDWSALEALPVEI